MTDRLGRIVKRLTESPLVSGRLITGVSDMRESWLPV